MRCRRRSAVAHHVRLTQFPHPERVHRPSGRGAADRVAGRRRPARNPSGPARGRRQLQRRQGLHRSRSRPGHGPGRAAQLVVKIVRDELLALFAGTEGGLTKDAPKPRVVLLLGLQGAGKTTTSGKLGRWLKRQGQNPVMVSTDVRRPAAIQQLEIVGEQAGVKVYAPDTMDPVARAKGALAEAKAKGFDTVIVDTAGRLHIDDELMNELQAIKAAVE